MSAVQLFNFKGRELRTVIVLGEPWFVAKDAGEILGLTDVRKSAEGFPTHWKDRSQIPTPGGLQEMLVINESGLYRLVMRSDKPEAVAFQDWIAGEVLPSIRKTGSYVAPNGSVPLPFLSDDVRKLVVDTVTACLATQRQPGSEHRPVVFLQDRVAVRWPDATKRNKNRIRQVFRNMCELHNIGDWKEHNWSPARLFVDQADLNVLDAAIDWVLKEVGRLIVPPSQQKTLFKEGIIPMSRIRDARFNDGREAA